MFQLAIPLVLLSFAAYDDGKKQRIPDGILCLLWLGLVLFFPEGAAPASWAFAFLYVLNTLTLWWLPKPLFGWADILLLPPFFGFLWVLGHPWLALLGPGGMFFSIWEKKKPVALAPFCLYAFFIGAVFYLLPGVWQFVLTYGS